MTCSARPAGQRGAFTLLELLAASILLAILMSATLLVLRASLAGAAAPVAPATSIEPLREQLRLEIANARGAVAGLGVLSLTGHVATDPQTRQPTLGRGSVTYRQVGSLLIRESQSLGQPPVREVVWGGVGSFATSIAAEADATQPPTADALGLPPAPQSIFVVLTDAEGRAVLRANFFNHRAGTP